MSQPKKIVVVFVGSFVGHVVVVIAVFVVVVIVVIIVGHRNLTLRFSQNK